MDEQRKQFEEWLEARLGCDEVDLSKDDDGVYSSHATGNYYVVWIAAQEAAKQKWKIMCGDWRDELVSIHGDNGLIVSGLTMGQASKLVDARGGKDQDSVAGTQQ
ncbi:MAG: hypothetical protein RR390_00685 [Hafnia sp.]